ncbi:MAG: hypothetical protein AAF125_08760 [Chloroflexota bacterium]
MIRHSTRYSLLLIFAVVGIVLRFWKLSHYPAIYTDEATHLEIARQLSLGHIQYFAVQDSWLLFARLPLFEYILAGLFVLFDVELIVVRGLTATCGLLTGLLLYVFLANVARDWRLPLVVFCLWNIFPQAVLYHRFGFSYNLLQPLIVLILWGLYHYHDQRSRRGLLLAVVGLTIGTLSDIIMWSFIPIILLATLNNWRDGVWAVPLSLLPLSFWAVSQLAAHPQAFLFDLSYTLARTGGGTLHDQLGLLVHNYTVLLGDTWWLIAIIGWVLLKNRTLQVVVGMLLLPLLLVGRTVPLYSLSAYYLIPFLPLVVVGVATFGVRSWDVLGHRFGRLTASGLMISLIGLPLGYTLHQDWQGLMQEQPTPIDRFLVDVDGAREAAQYIDDNVASGSLVVASAPVGWQIDTSIRVLEFQMAAVADGRDAVHIPGNLPATRWAYQTTLAEADYLVVDPLWRNWGAVHIPQVAAILSTLEEWERVHDSHDIEIYRNPHIR